MHVAMIPEEMQPFHQFNFLLLLIFLSTYFTRKPNKISLKNLPILVRLNIMEDNAAKELEKVRSKMKELQPDVFYQMWLGTFDYIFCGNKIVGTVEVKSSQVFSIAENNSWLFSHTNVKSIVAHFAKHKISEIPCWDSHSITCKITLHDAIMMRHFFIPSDILNERHYHNIKWQKKLVA